ncbi:MAG: hypothetical protein Q9226_005240 [Calogaya cf. arnoldii]
MPINKRRANTCNPGYSFYTCAASGFKGCCSSDACALGGCLSDQEGIAQPSQLASTPKESVDEYKPAGASFDADRQAAMQQMGPVPTALAPQPIPPRIPSKTFASTSTPTVQSSSAMQASPTASETPTGFAYASAAAATTAAAVSGTSSSSSTSKTPIIIGVVVGVVVAAIAIWLVWFGVRKKRRRIRDEATKPKRDHWLQGSPESEQRLGISSGMQGRIGHDGLPHSPMSYMYPSKQEVSVPSSESSPNNGGLFPSPGVPLELSVEPSPRPELSLNPEILEINKARDQAGLFHQGTPTTDSHPSPRNVADSTEMRSNLEVSDEENKRRGSHVMSWMSYSNGTAGPAHGAG